MYWAEAVWCKVYPTWVSSKLCESLWISLQLQSRTRQCMNYHKCMQKFLQISARFLKFFKVRTSVQGSSGRHYQYLACWELLWLTLHWGYILGVLRILVPCLWQYTWEIMTLLGTSTNAMDANFIAVDILLTKNPNFYVTMWLCEIHTLYNLHKSEDLTKSNQF